MVAGLCHHTRILHHMIRVDMFEVRETPCSVNKTVWDEDKSRFKCVSSINVYHCIQDERNRSGEICIQPVWVQRDYCPEFNTGANALDTVPCNGSTGCPNVTFLSDEVYRYPVCLNKTHPEDGFSTDGRNFSFWLWIVIPVLLVILLSTICFIVWRRKKFFRNGNEESRELLTKDPTEPFHKTAAFHEAVSFLKDGGRILILTGQWGSGKTTVAKRVYTEVTGKSPIIIRNHLEFDVNKHHQPVIFDEAISGNASEIEVDSIKEKLNRWSELMFSNSDTTKTFLIFTSLDANSIFWHSPNEKKKVINLSESLTKGDLTQILHSHFQHYFPNKKFSNIEDIALKCNNKSLGYPEICALFCRNMVSWEDKGPVVICNWPLRYLRSHLETMHHSINRDKFLLLVFMSLNEMEIDVQNPNEILFEILDSCKTCKHLSKEQPVEASITGSAKTEEVRETFEDKSAVAMESKSFKYRKDEEFVTSLIPSEFVDKVQGTPTRYRLQHDVIKRMTLVVFGTCHFDKLLKFSEKEDLKGWIELGGRIKSIKTSQGEIKPVLYVNENQWKAYVEKMEGNPPSNDF